MNEADLRKLSEGQDYMGPTLLASLQIVKGLERFALCMICPAAQWYETDDERFVAYCTRFHQTMYDHKTRIIVACDAREDAVADLERRPSAP